MWVISSFTSDVQFGLECGSWPFLACYKSTARIYAYTGDAPPEFLERIEKWGTNWKIIAGDDADALVAEESMLAWQDPPFDELYPYFVKEPGRAALALGLIDGEHFGEHFVPYASIILPARAFQALLGRIHTSPRIFVEIEWRGFCGPHVPLVPSYSEFVTGEVYLTRGFSIQLREPTDNDRLDRKPGQRPGD